jgi:hypothetical protein
MEFAMDDDLPSAVPAIFSGWLERTISGRNRVVPSNSHVWEVTRRMNKHPRNPTLRMDSDAQCVTKSHTAGKDSGVAESKSSESEGARGDCVPGGGGIFPSGVVKSCSCDSEGGGAEFWSVIGGSTSIWGFFFADLFAKRHPIPKPIRTLATMAATRITISSLLVPRSLCQALTRELSGHSHRNSLRGYPDFRKMFHRL